MEQQSNIDTEQKVIEKLRGLPPQQLDEILQFIDFVSQQRREKAASPKADDLKASILSLRGRGKGEHLVDKLLRSRREDQRHDERK